MGGSSSSYGYRIVRCEVNSPAQSAGIEDYFDFIVGINEVPIDQINKPFNEIIKQHKDNSLTLQVYNIRSVTTRPVIVRPNSQWGGQGLLGATIRYESIDNTENQGVHVLEVLVNSPAAKAQLIPNEDYILGTKSFSFISAEHFANIVSANINQSIELFVYNRISDSVRTTILIPDNQWGGRGCLGCDIADGVFHRIPSKQQEVEQQNATQIVKEEKVELTPPPVIDQKLQIQAPPQQQTETNSFNGNIYEIKIPQPPPMIAIYDPWK